MVDPDLLTRVQNKSGLLTIFLLARSVSIAHVKVQYFLRWGLQPPTIRVPQLSQKFGGQFFGLGPDFLRSLVIGVA
jgi:capsule polysaccharide export protein KpsC/LpsZ